MHFKIQHILNLSQHLKKCQPKIDQFTEYTVYYIPAAKKPDTVAFV